MKKFTPEELKAIIDAHYKWLKDEEGGSHADLSGADLSGADLRHADLSDADLRRAVLSDADLSGADLSDADLRRAVLSGAVEKYAKVPSLHRRILAAIDAGGTLDMGSWHQCETTHCRSGWSIHFAGPAGAMLEACLGPDVAGALIHLASCPHLEGKVPNFYASTEEALADIKRLAELEPPLEMSEVHQHEGSRP